jgi:outer membrane receptor protein involved in Fe transport
VVPLGEQATAGRDLGDLLDRTAGVQVLRYGGLGSFSLAGVRGSSPGQILVCLDGVPLATAGDGFVDLARLPVSSFGHAEVYRGAQVASFGGASAAGVINLITPVAQRTPWRLTLTGGSFGTSAARGQWGGARGPLSAFLSGQLRRSHGDFPYLDRNGTLFGNDTDDRMVHRANNDFHDAAFLGKGSWRIPLSAAGDDPSQAAGPTDATSPSGAIGPTGMGGATDPIGATGVLRLDYTAQQFRRDGGVPGLESVQTRHVRFRSDRARHELTLRGTLSRAVPGVKRSARPGVKRSVLPGTQLGALPEALRDGLPHERPGAGPARIEAAAYTERVRDRFDNRDGEVGLGRVATDDRTREEGGYLAWTQPWSALAQEPRLRVDLRNERRFPFDRLRGGRGFTRERRHRALSLEDRAFLGPLTLEGSYRWARAADNYGGPSGWMEGPAPAGRVQRDEGPAFGLRLDCGRGWVVKANRGRLARFPTFPELFGQNGVQEGNPALRPERGVQWDLGASWAPGRPWRAEAAYFESLVEDRILLLQNSQRTVIARNLDRAWVRGVEASGFLRVPLPRAALELSGSTTWQDTRDLGASPVYHGKRLPNLPALEAFLSASLLRGAWKARWDLAAGTAHFRDRYNAPEKRTPGSTTHDLAVERVFGRGIARVRVETRNLLDQRREDIDGFPLPGRSYLVEITVGKEVRS